MKKPPIREHELRSAPMQLLMDRNSFIFLIFRKATTRNRSIHEALSGSPSPVSVSSGSTYRRQKDLTALDGDLCSTRIMRLT